MQFLFMFVQIFLKFGSVVTLFTLHKVADNFDFDVVNILHTFVSSSSSRGFSFITTVLLNSVLRLCFLASKVLYLGFTLLLAWQQNLLQKEQWSPLDEQGLPQEEQGRHRRSRGRHWMSRGRHRRGCHRRRRVSQKSRSRHRRSKSHHRRSRGRHRRRRVSHKSRSRHRRSKGATGGEG